MALTPHEEAMLTAIGETIVKEIEHAIKPLLARIAQLEQRGFKGAYQKAMAYPAQSLVVHGSALWFSVREIPCGETPGDGNTGWQLAIKSPLPPRQSTPPRTNGFQPVAPQRIRP